MSSELKPGQMCGPFEIVKKIGAGGLGVVYLAEHAEHGTSAVKTAQLSAHGIDDVLARFKREIQILLNVDHVNVVRFYEAGRHERVLYLGMEYIEGRTFRDIIREKRDTLDPQQVARWGKQIADGLAALHEIRVVHRDIKPSNLMQARGDIVKLLDMGISKPQDWGLPSTHHALRLGTVGYMAPEQVRGDPVDYRTDIFALGIVLYELSTGVHPFNPRDETLGAEEAMARALNMDLIPITALRPQFPPRLAGIIMRALEREAHRRPQTALEIRADLSACFHEIRDSRKAVTVGITGSFSVPDPSPDAPPSSVETRPVPVDGSALAMLPQVSPASATTAPGRMPLDAWIPGQPRTFQIPRSQMEALVAEELGREPSITAPFPAGYPSSAADAPRSAPSPYTPGAPVASGGRAILVVIAVAALLGLPAGLGLGVWRKGASAEPDLAVGPSSATPAIGEATSEAADPPPKRTSPSASAPSATIASSPPAPSSQGQPGAQPAPRVAASPSKPARPQPKAVSSAVKPIFGAPEF